jgi:hypothetical protein
MSELKAILKAVGVEDDWIDFVASELTDQLGPFPCPHKFLCQHINTYQYCT